MSVLKIRKVTALPVTLEASTMYMVASAANASLFDLHVTSADGLSVRHVISQSEIAGMITAAVGSFNTVDVVATIAARNALTPTVNTQVLVLDATGDATVLAGAATYVYDVATTSWYKVSESESLDVVLDWATIQNKPVSSVTQIDQAVSNTHTHANKSLLDGISSVGGHLYSAGVPVRSFLEEETW